MDRRDFLSAIGLGAASLAIPGCSGSSDGIFGRKSAQRPNIIFIMADDHASHTMSCYDSKVNKTANLDRLAREGIRFTNCSCTNSICAPSRAVILTGKHSHLNGQTDNTIRFDGSQQTFPKLLQKASYQTAMIGKWHLKSPPTGFDYWNILPGQGHYYNPVMIEMGRRKKLTGYVTDIITDCCLNWIRDHQKNKPFCLMCHHKASHRIWEPGPKHMRMYDDITIPEPDTFFDDYRTRSDAAREQDMRLGDILTKRDLKLIPPRDLNEQQLKVWNAAYEPKNEAFRKANLTGRDLLRWKYQRFIKDYLRCIASVDDNVGRLLDYLDESGLSKNTIVIYTSDQGFFVGDHGWLDKRFMYKESFKMPLLVRYPGNIKPDKVSDDLVQNLDFAPTFLDYAGVKTPGDMQGRSLRPIMESNTPNDWRKSVFYHYYEYPSWSMVKRHYGIRTMRYKLMHFYYDIDAWELYDLQKDPDELNNVYDDPAYAGPIKLLKIELQRLRNKYNDHGDPDKWTQKFLLKQMQQICPKK